MSERRLTKIRVKDGKVEVRFQRRADPGRPWDDYSMACSDLPRPELESALQDLAVDVIEICCLPDDYREGVTISGARRGQIMPGVVFRNAQRKPQLAAGYRRLAAIQAINADPTRYGLLPTGGALPFRAVFRDLNADNAWTVNLAENRQREFGQLDKAYAARLLMERLGKSLAEAAAELGLSTTRTTQLLSMLSLPDCVLRLVQIGKLAEANARLLLGLRDPVIQSLAARLDAGDITVAELVAEATREHKRQGDPVRRTWSQAKRELKAAEENPAVAYVEDYFAGDLAEGGLRALIEAVPEETVQRLYERYRIDLDSEQA